MACEEEDRLLWEARRLEICYLALANGTRASYRCQLRRHEAWLGRRELMDALLARHLLYHYRGDAERGMKKLPRDSLRAIVSAVQWRASSIGPYRSDGRPSRSSSTPAETDRPGLDADPDEGPDRGDRRGDGTTNPATT